MPTRGNHPSVRGGGGSRAAGKKGRAVRCGYARGGEGKMGIVGDGAKEGDNRVVVNRGEEEGEMYAKGRYSLRGSKEIRLHLKKWPVAGKEKGQPRAGAYRKHRAQSPGRENVNLMKVKSAVYKTWDFVTGREKS